MCYSLLSITAHLLPKFQKYKRFSKLSSKDCVQLLNGNTSIHGTQVHTIESSLFHILRGLSILLWLTEQLFRSEASTPLCFRSLAVLQLFKISLLKVRVHLHMSKGKYTV